MRSILALILCLAVPVVACAGDTSERMDGFQKVDRGWFFYHDPELSPDPAAPIEPPPLSAISPRTSAPAPEVGTAAWIRETLPIIRDRAIDDPSPRNVQLFAYTHRLMVDKSERFAHAYIQANATDPFLTDNEAMPGSAFARKALSRERDKKRTQVLKSLSDNVSIWYFFRSDCPFCAKQNGPLIQFAQKYDFTILPISTDGRPLDGGDFANWVPDSGQAAKLGIDATPTMYLVRPPDEMVVYGIGLQSLPELETRILRVAHGRKWITDEQYDDAVFGTKRRYLVEGFDPSTIPDPDDPDDLLQALKAAAFHGTSRPSTGESR